MATIRSFEELDVWQMARVFCREIYKITKAGEFARDFDLSKQIRKSSGSIMDNIAEGFERNGRKEFIQFLSIAKGSSGESRSQLYRALDCEYVTETVFQKLHSDCTEISRKLSSLISYLQKSEYRGSKFQEPELTYEVEEHNSMQIDFEREP
ncbi:MAG TPA: four helix bundle protein [Chryseosolibacter sp.]|nr:four helix bundle protein [Chryseosolibacter sp.]